MRVTVCDRCGQQFDLGLLTEVEITVSTLLGIFERTQSYDLCSSCIGEFRERFMKMKKTEAEK